VYLVGAGPGDPGLLTLRACEVLARATFVLYDQLVSPRILERIPAACEAVSVRDLPGHHPERWPHIHDRLISEARKGHIVVRLKGGDPLIFGRGGEEAEALREAGIAYEIVPGITTALAAGAYADLPLTHRLHSSAIALVTGHEQPGKVGSLLDWKALAAFPGTMVIYMGMGRVGIIVAELVKYGKHPDTPAMIVHRVSTGEQKSAKATLGTAEAVIRREGLTNPSLIVVGAVVEARPEKSWFELRPLLNRRVLVTRPRAQAEPMLRALELLGAVPCPMPLLEIVGPADDSAAKRAIADLARDAFDWLIFTSSNGVDSFFARLEAGGLDSRVLGRTKIACVGRATASTLRAHGLIADLTPLQMTSEGILRAAGDTMKGRRILLAQADGARDLLRIELGKAATVTSAAFYAQKPIRDEGSIYIDALRRAEVDVVTITSPNIAGIFADLCDETIRGRIERGEVHLVSNGPRITKTLVDRGLTVRREADDPTMEAILDAVVSLYAVEGVVSETP